jgi:hypothetical protein
LQPPLRRAIVQFVIVRLTWDRDRGGHCISQYVNCYDVREQIPCATSSLIFPNVLHLFYFIFSQLDKLESPGQYRKNDIYQSTGRVSLWESDVILSEGLDSSEGNQRKEEAQTTLGTRIDKFVNKVALVKYFLKQFQSPEAGNSSELSRRMVRNVSMSLFWTLQLPL